MLPSTVTIKTASSSGIFSHPSVFCDLLETKQVLQKRKCTKKSVAHLVKAGKTGQKTDLYFSQEQVRSYDKDEVLVI